MPNGSRNAKTVGITAGASAPEVLVEDVIEALRRLNPVDVSQLPGRHETIEFRLPPELTEGNASAPRGGKGLDRQLDVAERDTR